MKQYLIGILLLLAMVVPVFGAGYSPSVPILVPGSQPTLGRTLTGGIVAYTGSFIVMYPDGQSVFLAYDRIMVMLCGDNNRCQPTLVQLTYFAPRTYNYTLT